LDQDDDNDDQDNDSFSSIAALRSQESSSTSSSKALGFPNATDTIVTWLARADLSHDLNDPEYQEIIREFIEIDEDGVVPLRANLYSSGGSVGEMSEESESWYKETTKRNPDPYGILENFEKNVYPRAKELNLTLMEYTQKYLKTKIEPTVTTVKMTSPRDDPSIEQFATTQFTYPVYSLLERVPWCTCWYGQFFEVEARKDLEITGLYVQSGIYWGDFEDVMNISVYTREGIASGHELIAEDWTLVGQDINARLPLANFSRNSNPKYGKLTLDQPLLIKGGTIRSFLVHTSNVRGIVLRAKYQSSWLPGEVTDSNEDMDLRAGRLPVDQGGLSDAVFKHVYHMDHGSAFVGIIDYRLL